MSIRVFSLAILTLALHLNLAAPPARAAETVPIGALFSLSGSWSTLGRTSVAALEKAVADINADLAADQVDWRLRPLVEDTRLEPDRALECLRELRRQGARVVIGPQSSAEIQFLWPHVRGEEVLLVSQGSTAHALAIPDDNIFRFCPDDVLEGRAVAALMRYDGIRAYISLGRYDAGNSGLQLSTRKAFGDVGGILVGGVRYSPQFDHDFTSELTYLTAKLAQGHRLYGDAVAIYATAFDEIARVFYEAAGEGYTPLGQVRWYGSNGVVQSAALRNNPKAARFAEQTGYPNPIFGLDEALRDRWEPIARFIRDKTGLRPDTYALAVYDAAWVAARALRQAGPLAPFAAFRTAFVAQADAHAGITGPTALNAAGDRKYGDYDFWAIRSGEWQRVAVYSQKADRITVLASYGVE